MAQQQQDAVVLNMGDLNINQNDVTSPAAPKKKQDTLFGPNIGIVARGPEWTESREKVIDELTPEIVKGWIAKSKQVSPSVACCISAFLVELLTAEKPTSGSVVRALNGFCGSPQPYTISCGTEQPIQEPGRRLLENFSLENEQKCDDLLTDKACGYRRISRRQLFKLSSISSDRLCVSLLWR
jgi:hypothetical protein